MQITVKNKNHEIVRRRSVVIRVESRIKTFLSVFLLSKVKFQIFH